MAVLAPPQQIAQLLVPKQVFTDSYLNDPIEFAPNPNFIPTSALKQLQVINIIDVDQAGYNIIDLNASKPQFYSATTTSAVNTREAINRLIDKTFNFF